MILIFIIDIALFKLYIKGWQSVNGLKLRIKKSLIKI